MQRDLAWQITETVFARLRIWACGEQRVLLGVEAGEVLCGLTDRVFWDTAIKKTSCWFWRGAVGFLPLAKKELEKRY